MRKTMAGAAAAATVAGLVALLGACALVAEPTPEPSATDPTPAASAPAPSGPLDPERAASGADGVGGLGFDVVALDPDGDGLVVHRLGDR